MAEENVPAAPPSIAESLASAIETIPLDDTPAPAAPAATPAAPAPAETAETPAEAQKRIRDASGRFTKTADTPSHVTTAPQPTAPAVVPPPAEPDAAPAGWREEAKAKWAALDPVVKAEITRRERDVNVGLQRAAEVRKFGDSMMTEIAPYMEDLKSDGASPQEAVRALLETAYMLKNGSPEHKRALMLALIQQYGVSFEQPVDTNRARLEWELDSRKHAEFRAGSDAQQRMAQEANNDVETFASQPGHEHFGQVRQIMAGLVREGQAQNLQDAYDQAVWAHPYVRAQLLQQQNLARVQDVNKNRRATLSVSGAPGPVSVAPAVDPKDLRATIEAQFSADRV